MKKLLLLITFSLSTLGFSQGPFFLLDDDPDNPVCGGVVAGLFTAECPSGFACPQFPNRIGFSPTLPGFACGTDIISPGPVLAASILGHDYSDSISTNHAPWPALPNIELKFSVSRETDGVAGSAVHSQFVRRQAAADVFLLSLPIPEPGQFAGFLGGANCFSGFLPTAGMANNNTLLINQGALGLVPAAGPGLLTPPHARATKDNIQGLDFNLTAQATLYYTVPPADFVLNGFQSADILTQVIGGAPAVWANHVSMGLCNGDGAADNVDALAVFDQDMQAPFPAQAGIDYALFSLAQGSQTLGILQAAGIPANPGTIFFTDFSGHFAIYALSTDLAIQAAPNMENHMVNVDAIDFKFVD